MSFFSFAPSSCTAHRGSPPKWAALAGALFLTLAARADQLVRYDFSQVTSLASRAINGQNVQTPVPGFDLLLMVNGKEVYHTSFGAFSIDQVANADSATKTISGAVIASLLDSSPRPFSLDTTIGQYLTGLPADKAAITVRQAFSHTSGISANTTQANFALANSAITTQQAAAQILQPNLQFTPGSAFAYGGASMQVAGAVAELAGQSSWNALFQSRISAPLNLQETRYVLAGPSNPRIAGGCESTATEFARVMEMLRRGGLYRTPSGIDQRIIAADKVQLMFTRQSPIGVPIINSPLPGSSDYGIGVWLDQRDSGGNLIGALAAGARGFSSWIDFDDNIVGAFATDTTSASNVLNLLYLIRDAAQSAVRTGVRCTSDFNADGIVSVQDLFDFLVAWFSLSPSADINAVGGISVQDIFDFLTRWFDGC